MKQTSLDWTMLKSRLTPTLITNEEKTYNNSTMFLPRKVVCISRIIPVEVSNVICELFYASKVIDVYV